MARVRETKSKLRQQNKRTSWTRFYLPRGQDWPTWPAGHSDAHIGPLAAVPGRQKVWLGRNVDDPEQAALIILWESAEALQAFQNSPACGEFLQGLPENHFQGSLDSRGLLWSPYTDGAGDASSSRTPDRFVSFQWNSGYQFEEALQGRMTITILAIPYTGDPIPDSWSNIIYNTFSQFLPRGCEDLRVRWPDSRMHFWTAWAWVDTELSQQQVAAGKESGQALLCEFRRLNGYHGATPELEETLAKSPQARESWAQTVAKVTPPVTAWDQERWDIRLAPQFIKPEQEEEEQEDEEEVDEEYERNMKEFLEQLD